MKPLNFPGEAPLASVLAALPAALLAASAEAPPRRSGRAPAPRVIVDPVAPTLHAKISMRSRKRAPPPVSRVHTRVDGAWQKVNGRWSSRMFPGREFDDLDAYRAAKKQREERRAAFADQAYAWHH